MHTQVLYRLTAMHKLTETTTPMHILVNASMSRSDSLSFPHFPVVKTLQRPSVGRSEEMLRAKQVGQVLRALVDFATKHDVFEVPWDVVRTGLVGPSFSVKEEGDPPSFGWFWLISANSKRSFLQKLEKPHTTECLMCVCVCVCVWCF